MKWWDDLWLNEGFASFAEYLAVSRIYPEWAMTDQFISSKTLPALRTDALSTSHPVSVPVSDPVEIEAVFDTISYNKVRPPFVNNPLILKENNSFLVVLNSSQSIGCSIEYSIKCTVPQSYL